MNPELTDIPFDHFQRYGAASALVEALGGRPVERILEVGANRQRILKSFLPQTRFVFSDLEPQDPVTDGEDVFVRADATDLPFADCEFDAVVSLDVMEHIPPSLRARAVSEMARVAGRAVIIGCPLDHPWVHEAEEKANAIWEKYFGVAYPWLEEHKEFGLVDPLVVEKALQCAGLHTVRFGQGDVDVWSGMMGAHFIKEAIPELADVVLAADRLYNQAVFAGDRIERAYREFFVAVRDPNDFARLKASPFLTGESDQAVKAMLSRLAGGLCPVVDRIRHAEKEWSNTASLVYETQAALDSAHSALAAANAELAQREDIFRRAEDSLALADERALELALSSGRMMAIADSMRERNDELKQSLAEEQRHRDILGVRVRTLERRQRWLACAVVISVVFLVGVVITHYLMD